MSKENNRITVALDIMGADTSPEFIMEGGLWAAREKPDLLQVALIGKKEIISDYTRRQKSIPDNIIIENAPHAVAMTDTPTEGIRKKNSSIAIGLQMQKDGKTDAFVSAGNTGAVMASSILVLGRVEGVLRPAIGSFFPSAKGKPTLVLDVGANAECKPTNLYQFGVMGSVYTSLMYGRTSPRIGLLSIGEERSKGNELIFQAHEIFEKSGLNFVGNVEGRDILAGKVDVVATDGFVGNIVLKFAESVEGFLTESLKHQIQTNIFSRMGAALMLPFLKRLRRSFDYSEYGGAPLLGVDGVAIICHGSSSTKAIKNAVLIAMDMARHKINSNIKQEMLTLNNGNGQTANDQVENNRSGIASS